NASSIGSHMLAAFDGTRFVSTSTPTVASILATSTNATSTFAGGLSVGLLNVASTTATSTFAYGVNLNGGCFSINNNCLVSGSSFPFTTATSFGTTANSTS